MVGKADGTLNSALWLLFQDFVFDVVDPAGKLIATKIPDAWVKKMQNWVNTYPAAAFVVVPVLEKGTRVTAQLLLNASKLFHGRISPEAEKQVEDIFDDALGQILRSAKRQIEEGGSVGGHAIGTSVTSGEMVMIEETKDEFMIHESRACERAQIMIRKGTREEKVFDEPEPTDVGGKGKGQKQRKFHMEKREPTVISVTPERAAALRNRTGHGVCTVCRALDLINEAQKKDASSKLSMPLRPWFAEAVTRITASLNDAHRDLFADEVGLATRDPGFWKKMEQYKEFHKELTLLDLITLFQLPAKPVLPPKKPAEKKAERTRVETEFATVIIPQWEADCAMVRTQRETLFTEAANGLTRRKTEAEQQKMLDEAHAMHEAFLKKVADKHHEQEETEKAEQWGQKTFGLTEAESKGDFSQTESFIWDIFPFGLLRQSTKKLISKVKSKMAPPAAPAAGTPPTPTHGGTP